MLIRKHFVLVRDRLRKSIHIRSLSEKPESCVYCHVLRQKHITKNSQNLSEWAEDTEIFLFDPLIYNREI